MAIPFKLQTKQLGGLYTVVLYIGPDHWFMSPIFDSKEEADDHIRKLIQVLGEVNSLDIMVPIDFA